MANSYSDHPEIGFYLNHPLMKRIVELKEKGFADAKDYADAPVDHEDAIENEQVCPECGGHNIDRLQRITGYLVGTTDRWNSGKLAELKDRVTHS